MLFFKVDEYESMLRYNRCDDSKAKKHILLLKDVMIDTALI